MASVRAWKTIVDHYRTLALKCPEHLEHFRIRDANFSRILEIVEQTLRDPRRLFRVLKVIPHESELQGAAGSTTSDVYLKAWIPFRGISVESPEGAIPVRADQVLARYRWGIGYSFGQRQIGEAVELARICRTARDLSAQLNAVQRIESAWKERSTLHIPILFSDPAGRQFEDLMLDILNEEAALAQRATVEEDFQEKTDLRVNPIGLQRKRGARVQITQTVDIARYEEKLSAIRRLPEFVILSPVSLAQAVLEGEQPFLERRQLSIFWTHFPSRPVSVPALAREIKQLLMKALQAPAVHPLGPMAKVPAVLRELIRNYVVIEAFRSTNSLRERQRAEMQRPANSEEK